MLPFRVTVELQAMELRGYYTFPKAPALLLNIIFRKHVGAGGSYPTAEMESVYSTVPAD